MQRCINSENNSIRYGSGVFVTESCHLSGGFGENDSFSRSQALNIKTNKDRAHKEEVTPMTQPAAHGRPKLQNPTDMLSRCPSSLQGLYPEQIQVPGNHRTLSIGPAAPA